MADELDALGQARGAEDAFRRAAEESKAAGEGRNAEFRESLSLIKQLNDALAQSLDLERDQNATLDQRVKNQNLVNSLQNSIRREQGMFSKQEDKLSQNQAKSLGAQLTNAAKIQNISQSDIASKVAANKITEEQTQKSKILSDLTGGLSEKVENFVKALKTSEGRMVLLAAAVTGLVKLLLNVNQQITEIGRNLGSTIEEARLTRERFEAIQGSTTNVLNNVEEISDSQKTFNNLLGTSSNVINGSILDGMATLQNRIGLTAEGAARFAQSSMITGKSIKELKTDAVGVALSVEKESGLRLNIRNILKETSNITGQIRAQLGGSVEAIAKAVSKAKSLGMELKEVAAAGKQLLNFEQSISAELEAELLTGKQLNLEKARLAALTGDQNTLAEELAKNTGDFYEFSQLNVLQQESLAKALGMNADALSDILMDKANLEQLKERARQEGKEDVVANLERLSNQEKFNGAVEKIKAVVVNFVAALERVPFISSLLEMPANIAEDVALGLSSATSPQNPDIEGAIERGMSKARINVSTQYDSFKANNKAGSVYTGKITNNTSFT